MTLLKVSALPEPLARVTPDGPSALSAIEAEIDRARWVRKMTNSRFLPIVSGVEVLLKVVGVVVVVVAGGEGVARDGLVALGVVDGEVGVEEEFVFGG